MFKRYFLSLIFFAAGGHVNTTEQTVGMVRRCRRSYSGEFKVEAARHVRNRGCRWPPKRCLATTPTYCGWEAERTRTGRVNTLSAPVISSRYPWQLRSRNRRSGSISVAARAPWWPVSDASECAALLREATGNLATQSNPVMAIRLTAANNPLRTSNYRSSANGFNRP